MTDEIVKPGESQQTSTGLLERVKANDQEAWQRFVHLYSPLIYGWCRQAGLQEADAADVGQEVFRSVIGAIARFRRENQGDTLRGWLRTITANKVRDFARGKEIAATGGSEILILLLQHPDSDLPETKASLREDEDLLYRRAVECILAEFEEQKCQAFLRVVMQQQAAADVAADLGMTINAVYLAKSRILARLREEFADILENNLGAG